MAKTPFTAPVSFAGSVTYIVPAGKTAVFKAFAQAHPTTFMQIPMGKNGAGDENPVHAGPLTAAAGSVLSCGQGSVILNGFLYDIT